jgi:hypothetical protein
MSFSVVHTSVSLVLVVVFGVMCVGAYPIPYFLPASALGVSPLLASKASSNFYPIVV